MAQQLEEVLEELGIAQYLDSFLDQGFDTWETILDITESDLDALGVKLGHRRKLQRKIANFRGIAPDVALAASAHPSADDAPRPESYKCDAATYSADGRSSVPGVPGKRKYRRHPKPDESAPERPPSAYVLFSNKMRENLKGQNLSFTEIAKLVGEKWQTLTPSERKPYDSEAQAAKDKYNQAMVLYKKTPEYQRYILYLQEFKARHSNQAQDRDAFKRIKLADFASSHSTSANNAPSPGCLNRPRQRHRSDATSGSMSSTEGLASVRREIHHTGSSMSAYDSRYSSASPTPGPPEALADGSAHSPHSNGHSDWSPRPTSTSPRSGQLAGTPAGSTGPAGMSETSGAKTETTATTTMATTATMIATAAAGTMGPAEPAGCPVSLPSLSDVFESRELHSSGSMGPTAGPGNGAPDFRPSMLRHEQSSSGTSTSTMSSSGSSISSNISSNSTGNSGSSNGYPRTSMEGGSLPIHSLLSGKPPSPSLSPGLLGPVSGSASRSFRPPSSTSESSQMHKYSPPPAPSSRPFLPELDSHVAKGGGQFSCTLAGGWYYPQAQRLTDQGNVSRPPVPALADHAKMMVKQPARW